MEPLEIYDAINNKVMHVYVSTEVAGKCRIDNAYAQDLFNRLQEEDIEEGCTVEVQSIKSEDQVESELVDPLNDDQFLLDKADSKEVWSRHETLRLIETYKEYKDVFKEHKQRKAVWTMIAAKMSQHNIFKTAAKCAEKWKNLLRTYKIANDKPNAPTRFQFYQDMKEILDNLEMSDSETDENTERKYNPKAELTVETFAEEVPEKESWSRYETLKFLKAFQMFKHMKHNFSKEKHFWSIISAQLAKEDIHKHHEKCAAKWKNLLRSYKKNLEKPNTSTRFQYFQEVNSVLNDTELEIPERLMKITDGVEKNVNPEQFKTILEEAELENSKDCISWTADETLKLIQAYKKYKHEFGKCPSKKFVWGLISYELSLYGINRDVERVENKWKSLMRSFKKCQDKESTRFYFYEEMNDALDSETKENSTNSMDDSTEVIFENSDHAYTETANCEQIIIETEQEHEESDDNNKNVWSNKETLALLTVYADCRRKFKDLKKAKLWEEISKELEEAFNVIKSPENCERKWKKLLGTYKVHKLSNTGPGRFRFYKEIHDIVNDELGDGGSEEVVFPKGKCKCSEKRSLEKQKRHMERMQMLKRKLDLEERKVEAFEMYVKHLTCNSSGGDDNFG